ncbi:hypothetical protein FRC20_003375 [Serendipita sp. 405]|nr:hypothetical protein FRC20_003375 [Serendipita sp. 405]
MVARIPSVRQITSEDSGYSAQTVDSLCGEATSQPVVKNTTLSISFAPFPHARHCSALQTLIMSMKTLFTATFTIARALPTSAQAAIPLF